MIGWFINLIHLIVYNSYRKKKRKHRSVDNEERGHGETTDQGI